MWRDQVTRFEIVVVVTLSLFSGGATLGEDKLFVARPLTKDALFTSGIEGPACDRDGNIYAVNFEKQGTIGRVRPAGESELFITLPDSSIGNGIRFDRDGNMFIADYTNHNVLRVAAGKKEAKVYSHNSGMNQPNDLAITSRGVLFASDPNWGNGTGQVWRIDPDGRSFKVAHDLGTTNGIEVSPDDKTLYVNESVQRNVWAFKISERGELSEKRLIKQFPDFGFDGMRCDVDGNLYITRHGKGTVVKLSPSDGAVLEEINVLGRHPTNICFGGPDGRTVYVTDADLRRIVEFRVDRPGREFKLWSGR